MLLLACFSFGCKSHTKLDETNRGADAFAPVLREKIVEFVSFIDSIRSFRAKEGFFYIVFEDRNEDMLVFIGRDFFYDKRRVKGYAFVNGELVVYEGNYSNREQYLVDTTKLIPLVDTIPNYWEIEDNDGMDYEVVSREFVIHGKDSLSWVVDCY